MDRKITTTTTPLWEEDADNYERHHSQCRANLGMTKESIARDVENLKRWLANHSYLPATIEGTDENKWLENYLLLNKNDLERTKINLEWYFKIRNTLPMGFTNRSPKFTDVYKSFKSVCLAVAPTLTKEGHMVVVFNHLTSRISDFEVVPFAKRMISMIDIHLRAGIHRSGTVLVLDLHNSRIGHLTRYQPIRLVRAFFSNVWTAYPERIAQIHIINSPFILQTMLAFFRPFLKEKIRKRIMIHSSLESLYEYVPKSHLPSDYGGDCPNKVELNWKWEKIMLENDDWLTTTATKHRVPEHKWPIE